MQLSALAVRRPVTTLMIFLAIVMLGLVSYKRLPVQLLPDIDFPTIMVFASNDRTPDENMNNITKPLEATISEMPRVKALRSVTVGGTVRIRVEFEYGTDLQYATVDIEERLATFRQSLGDRRTFINAFPFSTSDFQASFMFLSVRGRGDVQTLFQTAGEKVEQQLRSISGVADVELRGMTQNAIQVDMNPDLLSAYGLDFGRVMARVQAVSSEDTFLGRLRVPGETHFVRLNDRVRNAEELADIIVDERGIVRLRDVSTIEEGAAVDRWVSRSDGKNAINIRMEREAGRNLIELAKVTRQRVEEINATLPDGVELIIAEDLASYVEKAINTVTRLAIQGGLLALLVPFFFFRSFRVALIVFASVPICLISVFNLFDMAGMSINIFSIVGLALGVGMLVDNAIVVTENSIRLYQSGESPREAASRGGVEVGRGLFASTLTTVIVFLPFIFLDGEFKVLVKEPALGLAFPLAMSLLVSLTLVPVLVHLMLRSMAHRKSRMGTGQWRVKKWYARVLKASLRYRGRVIFFIIIAVTFTWLESCRRVNETATSQEANREWMEFHFQAPRGFTLSDVNRGAVVIEDRLIEHPNIRTFNVSFNNEGGHVSIHLKPRQERENNEPFREVEQTMLDFVGEVPGVNLSLRRFDNPLADPPINLGTEGSLEIKGLDLEVLNPYAERLIEALRNHPDITNAKITEERPDPQYLALFDREKTRLFGVNAEQVGRYVGATRSSGTITSLQLRDGENRTDVSFTISDASGGTIDDVRRMNVFTQQAGSVPFGELVAFQKAQGRALMRRRDRQASLQIAYYHRPTANASALGEDIKKIAEGLPNAGGVVTQLGGEAQRIDDRQGQFFFVIIAGMLLVYVVMAAVFESFWVPFAILATNPLMLIGIVWGLDIFGLPLDDLAAFGVIVLIGLAVNNGIVMMDRAMDMQRRGWGRTRAVFESSLTRLRPIAMTYLTTVLGLLPMAFIGEEGDQWRPVAVVIIGGLTSATILTLFVLPCFYLIGDDFVRWARRPFYNLLIVTFEIFEGATNLLMHPIRVLRRQLPFAPSFWPFASSLFALAFELLRTPARLLWRAPADAWFLLSQSRTGFQPVTSGDLQPQPQTSHLAPQPSEHPNAVTLSNIQVIYRGITGGHVHALAGIDLTLEPGLFGLLGPNGAGKTTLLRCIAGVLEPTRGTVRILGVSHREAGSRLAPLIGYLPQNRGHYEWMTLEQHLNYFATLTAQTLRRAETFEPADSPLRHALAQLRPLHDPVRRRQAVLAAAEEVNLAHVLKDPIATFSGGMKQRAGIARVLLQAPPILIVDEPTAGLDPVERVKVRLLLKRLSRSGLVLFSTHIVEDLEHSCDRLAILNRGHLLFQGTPRDLHAAWPTKRAADATMEDALLAVLGQKR